MANLKEVKTRITSVVSTQQITKAMKMVAAAKLRRSQERIIQMRPYAEKLNGILQNITSGNDDGFENVFGTQREVQKVLLVVVTSDRGLCGAFNSNVFKRTLKLIEDQYSTQHQNGNLTIMPVGKKSIEYFTKRNYPTTSSHSDLFGRLSFDNVKIAAEEAMQGFLEGNYDRVDIVYNEFKNVATQILNVEQFLPVAPVEVDADSSAGNSDYIYEPSVRFIVEDLIPKSLKIQFYKALLESNASENGARMTAMDKATENAGELLKELRLTYNRTRQAAITKEILEIVGGAEALGS